MKGITDEEIGEEVRTAVDLKGEIRATITSLDDLLRPTSSSSHHQEHIQNANASESPQVSPATSQPNVHVKLPKLEANRFNGKVEKWQEFWDCFESSIHTNTALLSVNKFSYLRGLLGGAAKTAIAGLTFTMANYQVAIALLKKRFGKAIVIERAHVNDLLNISPLYHDKDTAGLQRPSHNKSPSSRTEGSKCGIYYIRRNCCACHYWQATRRGAIADHAKEPSRMENGGSVKGTFD